MQNFSETLISWYKVHQRELPWRETKTPYFIWLSEVILQQTRVQQGLPYYLKFITRFPTVFDLAKSSEEDVLVVWKGLGYYSRARNMHKTAKYIADVLGGVFPQNYLTLKKLKGVGDYTAAAIASFCYQEAVPVVDGNVYRVLSRVFGVKDAIDSTLGKKVFKELADALMVPKKIDTYNQAIMEFGALQCVPKNPNCEICPLLNQCEAKSLNLIGELPFKSKKTKRRSRYFNYLIFKKEELIAAVKRGEGDIWANMYEFPMLESAEEILDVEQLRQLVIEKKEIANSFRQLNSYRKHILSHQDIHFAFWEAIEPQKIPYVFYSKEDLENLPFPKLLENYISNL